MEKFPSSVSTITFSEVVAANSVGQFSIRVQKLFKAIFLAVLKVRVL